MVKLAEVEDTTVEVRVCPCCGITYGAPARFFEQRREKGGGWWCPNGHTLSFTETEVDRLKKQLADQTRYWKRQADQHEEQLALQRRRTAAYKGEVTKLRNRVGRGVCPCCDRTFADLAQHMQAEHPDYHADDSEPAYA